MKTEFNKEVTQKKTIIFLFIMSVATGVLSVFTGHGIAAVSAGFLASLWYFESEEKRVFSYIAPAVIITLDFIINGLYLLVGVFGVVLGLMIFLVYKIKISKCESVFGMTLISSLLILVAYVIIGMQNPEGLSVTEYYKTVYEEYKVYFVDYFNDMYASIPEINETVAIAEEDIIAVLDSIVGMLVSFVIIYGFALTGIGCKIFTLMVKRYSKDKTEITNWRFTTPSLYAYFYMAITVAGFFVGTEMDTFALIISNLSNVFMIVYAYIGWSCIARILAARKHSILAYVVLPAVIVLFSGLALNILSFFGMFYTITTNRFLSDNNRSGGEQVK